MIAALARKLIVALWRYATQGVVIEGVILKPDQFRRIQADEPTPAVAYIAVLKNGLVLLSPPAESGRLVPPFHRKTATGCEVVRARQQ